MGLPITKTVTLVWDGVGWRDQETNFPITGVKLLWVPDDMTEKAVDPGVRLYDGTKVAESHSAKKVVYQDERTSRLVYWNESAGGWYDVETDVNVKNLTEPDPDERSQTDDLLPLIQQELDRRTVYPHMRMYFNSDPEDELLVTAAYVKSEIMKGRKVAYDNHAQLESRIIALHQRINALEKPWWKRW